AVQQSQRSPEVTIIIRSPALPGLAHFCNFLMPHPACRSGATGKRRGRSRGTLQATRPPDILRRGTLPGQPARRGKVSPPRGRPAGGPSFCRRAFGGLPVLGLPALPPPPPAAEPTPWALPPPSRPPLPAVRDAAWVRTPVDAFVLARLEQAGLRPAP